MEIDEVTVQQELVEVALDPSLLLYVKRDKKPTELQPQKQDPQSALQTVTSSVIPEQLVNLPVSHLAVENIVETDKTVIDNYNDNQLESSLLSSEVDVFPSLPTSSSRSRNSAVTAALRKVKRKPYREPLEPLNEIESSSNVDKSRNIDNESRLDKENDKHCRIEDSINGNDCNGHVSDDNEKELFSGLPSPCGSE